jgi:hypothetical protein
MAAFDHDRQLYLRRCASRERFPGGVHPVFDIADIIVDITAFACPHEAQPQR